MMESHGAAVQENVVYTWRHDPKAHTDPPAGLCAAATRRITRAVCATTWAAMSRCAKSALILTTAYQNGASCMHFWAFRPLNSGK